MVDSIFLKQENIQKLDDPEVKSSDVKISTSELLNALKLLKNESSPGLDGIPIEFYKFFWSDIKEIFTNCVKYIFEYGNLTPSQKESLICLLHKGHNLDREEIKNWRPIALCNSDYKIIAKLFAIRLCSVTDKLIDQNQSAFVKGRNISLMIREINDVIEREKHLKSSSIILSIDYAKAFDTISTSAIIKALRLYGFGKYFVDWIKILLKDRRCCIRNAGFISEPFPMERGVRQGCPISPILFILTTELLAASIRADPKIRGIEIPGFVRAIKIRFFADDTTLFLRDMIDFREVLSKIKQFSIFSGLQLNTKKSFALQFGNDDLNGTFKQGIKFVTKFKILGIYFSSKEEAINMDENTTEKIKNLKKNFSFMVTP